MLSQNPLFSTCYELQHTQQRIIIIIIMLQRATSTDTTVASAQDDEISEISLQTTTHVRMIRPNPVLVAEQNTTSSNEGIPAFICFLVPPEVKQEKQVVEHHHNVAADRPRRKMPRGAMQQVTIGQLVGESALVTTLPCTTTTTTELTRRRSCQNGLSSSSSDCPTTTASRIVILFSTRHYFRKYFQF